MESAKQVTRMEAVLRRASLLLILGGAFALAYYSFGWAMRQIYQATAAWQFEALRQQPSQLPAALPGEAGKGANDGRAVIPLGRLQVPRIGLDAMVAEGTGANTLLRAVGHIPGTALPGQPGNVGLAGHRDTFFRTLGEVRPGDTIRVETLQGTFVYRVRWKRVVTPAAVSVLKSGSVPSLTLVTCYPFQYVGAAPLRFAVRAELDSGPDARADSALGAPR